MQLFYTPDIQLPYYTLSETESKHCIRVLRLKLGDIMHLSDGKGSIFKAEIINANPKACELNIIETIENFEQRNYKLHLAVAPTKNIDRFEWFLEKATEIGVDEITPILCEHSERKVIKHERLERVIVAAMKQSIKAYKPKLNSLTSFSDFLEKQDSDRACFIAHCEDGQKQLLKSACPLNESVCVLIGPEGDFSPQEIKASLDKNFLPVSLGDSRLRTETAGVVACHTVSLVNQ